MAKTTITKALTGYFNVEPRKVTAQEWLKELRALTPDEKQSLAEGVVAITGDELSK